MIVMIKIGSLLISILMLVLINISWCQENSIHSSFVDEIVVTSNNNSSSTNLDSPNSAAVGLKFVVDGLTAPMEYISSGDSTGRMFIVDQTGIVQIVAPDGKLLKDPFIDLRDSLVGLSGAYDERGLLGLAFHPNYTENGRIFVYYSAPLRPGAPQGWSATNRLSEFHISKNDPNRIDMNSEKVLFQVDKPQMNHNGGTIAFGPDSYLYLPLGDGGGANDVGEGHSPSGNAQDPSKMLGKILRINVNNQTAGSYGIPSDNPFVGKSGFLPEIWALGLRNPWRISFDQEGRLFASDAGQNLWEEVDITEKGGNYGWNIREGTHCFDPQNPDQSPSNCPDKSIRGEPLIDPVIEYGHDQDRTVVVGGYIYDGNELPELKGSYVFADWSRGFSHGDGTLLMATPSSNHLWDVSEIAISGNANNRVNEFIRSLGQDDEGELYILTSDNAGPRGNTGKIYKLVSTKPSTS
jgi:glucose/arabinose dehydrogenase